MHIARILFSQIIVGVVDLCKDKDNIVSPIGEHVGYVSVLTKVLN